MTSLSPRVIPAIRKSDSLEAEAQKRKQADSGPRVPTKADFERVATRDHDFWAVPKRGGRS